MATKAELEAELARLREQIETLRAQTAQRPEETAPSEGTARRHLPAKLQTILDEHGIDTSNIDSLSDHLSDELVNFQRDHPVLALLSVFAIGCVVGRGLR